MVVLTLVRLCLWGLDARLGRVCCGIGSVCFFFSPGPGISSLFLPQLMDV